MEQKEVMIIRTLECDLCHRFDSVLLSREEINQRTNSNSLEIGTHIVTHENHLRIIYFDKNGEYLGDHISLNVTDESLHDLDSDIPLFKKESEHSLLSKFTKRMLGRLVNERHNLCIVGPSLAGKTSLTMYLETGVPERYTKRVEHSPTLGKSVKRFKFGSSNLTIFDMGGQKNFWSDWRITIQKSSKIIFVLDGTANNTKEAAKALSLVLENKKEEAQILILLNKLDLILEGYTNNFIEINEITNKIQTDKFENIWIIKTSVYNGLAYEYNNKKDQTELAEVITDYLSRELKSS